MELEEFKRDHDFVLNIRKVGRKLNVVTSILNKSNGKIVDKVEDNLDIPEMSSLIHDSQTSRFSFTPLTWEKLIEKAKRNQLDHFMKKYKISDCLPINADTSIEDIYSTKTFTI